MNKRINVWNRQSGKTTTAIYEFLKNPEETLLITFNENMCHHICKNFLRVDKHKNIIGVNKFLNRDLYLNRSKTIIIDEYLFFNPEQAIDLYQKIINTSYIENLIIFSTPRKKYNKEVFDLVKKLKPILQWQMCHKVIEQLLDIEVKVEDVRELYFNFLTDEDSEINKKSNVDKRESEHLKEILGEKKYSLEVLAEYLEEKEEDIISDQIFSGNYKIVYDIGKGNDQSGLYCFKLDYPIINLK
jgi:hypothetical protein